MRDTADFGSREYIPLLVSPLPTIDHSLELFRRKAKLSLRSSRPCLFFVAFVIGNRLNVYPDKAKEWCDRNFDACRYRGWTPDFLYTALGAQTDEAKKLRLWWYEKEEQNKNSPPR